MARAFLLTVVLVAVGLLGASTFNPDDGSLLRSEPLWRVFGLAAYLGLAGLYVIPIVALGRVFMGIARRAGRRRCGSV